MPHELAEHEDWRGHEKRHRVVLERRAVAIAHQVVEQPLRPRRISVDVVKRRLALRRDARREQHVGVAGHVLDQLDGDVTAKPWLQRVGRRHDAHPSQATGWAASVSDDAPPAAPAARTGRRNSDGRRSEFACNHAVVLPFEIRGLVGDRGGRGGRVNWLAAGANFGPRPLDLDSPIPPCRLRSQLRDMLLDEPIGQPVHLSTSIVVSASRSPRLYRRPVTVWARSLPPSTELLTRRANQPSWPTREVVDRPVLRRWLRDRTRPSACGRKRAPRPCRRRDFYRATAGTISTSRLRVAAPGRRHRHV